MTPDAFEALLSPLLDSAYRTALCLADGPADAEAMLQEAVTSEVLRVGARRTGRDLRCRILRSMTEIFRRRHRSRAARARARCRSGAPAEAVRIVTAIRALGPSSRVVAALYFSEGLTCSEIADLLRCARPAVRRRVAAVRTALSGLEGVHHDSYAREAGKLGTYRAAPEAGPAVSGESAFRAAT